VAAAVPSPSSRLTWLSLAFCAGVCALASTIGADARWLAALGREIASLGSIPVGVPYAAAPSADWVNVPVLGELTFHWLHAIGGDRGLLLAQLVATAASLALLAADMRARRAPDGARAVVLVAVLFAALPSFVVVRGQLFSLVLFSLTVVMLRAEARAPSRRIWLLVPLFALWSNLHGAVLVGLAIAAAYLLFDRIRREPLVAVGVLLASTAALFLTPALLDSGAYYLGVMQSEAAVRGEGLWAPLSLNAPFDVLFVALAVPLAVFAVRAHLQLWEACCAVALAAVAVHAGRNSVWIACFLAAPAAAGLGRTALGSLTVSRRTIALCGWAPVGLLVLGLAHQTPSREAGPRVRELAVSLADGRPILADGLDAERLALDGHRVWMTNPLDAFSRRDQRTYLDWLDAKSSGDSLLETEGAVVLVTRGSPPDRRLARDRAFRRVARDAEAVLYVRARSS
jgi:hypothetical protein